MKIEVKVITNAKENTVSKRNGGFVVRTTAVPEKGKANKKIFRLLANSLNIPVSSMQITKGANSNHKIIEY